MPWIVRILTEQGAGEDVTTAAILADSTGWAEVADPGTPRRVTLLVGFDTQDDANRFASGFQGAVVEPVDPSAWSVDRPAHVRTARGEVELEVGTAFGHGSHPTTELAIAAIEDLAPGEGRTLLDVGCGTGVLSIVAALHGFSVSGCDIDAEAVAISVRNAERNGVSVQVGFVHAAPSQLASPQTLVASTGFDIAVVNTLVGVHEAEGTAVAALTSGVIVVTGLQGEEQLLRAVGAYPGWNLADRRQKGPWLLGLLSPV